MNILDTLQQVSPHLAASDLGHQHCADSEFPSQSSAGFASSPAAANLQNVRGCQFGVRGILAPERQFGMKVAPVTITASKQFGIRPGIVIVAAAHPFGVEARPAAITHTRPAFLDCIFHVVTVRPEPEMIRPDAWAVVAGMQHPQAGGNVSVREQVGDTVRAMVPAGEVERAIARCGGNAAGPYPTRAEFGAVGRDRAILVDLRPEAGEARRPGIYSYRHRSIPSVSTPPAVSAARGHFAATIVLQRDAR